MAKVIEETAITYERGIPKIFAVEETHDGITIWVPGFCEIRATDREKASRSWKQWINWYGEQVGPHIAALYLAPLLGIRRPGTFNDLLFECRARRRIGELSRAVELARVEVANRVFRKFAAFCKVVYKTKLPREFDDDANDRDRIGFGRELEERKQRIRQLNERRAKA